MVDTIRRMNRAPEHVPMTTNQKLQVAQAIVGAVGVISLVGGIVATAILANKAGGMSEFWNQSNHVGKAVMLGTGGVTVLSFVIFGGLAIARNRTNNEEKAPHRQDDSDVGAEDSDKGTEEPVKTLVDVGLELRKADEERAARDKEIAEGAAKEKAELNASVAAAEAARLAARDKAINDRTAEQKAKLDAANARIQAKEAAAAELTRAKEAETARLKAEEEAQAKAKAEAQERSKAQALAEATRSSEAAKKAAADDLAQANTSSEDVLAEARAHAKADLEKAQAESDAALAEALAPIRKAQAEAERAKQLEIEAAAKAKAEAEAEAAKKAADEVKQAEADAEKARVNAYQERKANRADRRAAKEEKKVKVDIEEKERELARDRQAFLDAIEKIQPNKDANGSLEAVESQIEGTIAAKLSKAHFIKDAWKRVKAGEITYVGFKAVMKLRSDLHTPENRKMLLQLTQDIADYTFVRGDK